MRLPAGVLTLTLVLTGTATACMPDSFQSVRLTQQGPDSTADAHTMNQALLTLGDLSDKFEVDEDDGSEDDGADWGCLTPSDPAADDSDDAEISFSAKREPGLPGVFNAVTEGSGAPSEAKDAFDTLADSFRDCTSVHTRDADGTRWDFDVTTDTTGWATGGDQQINVVAIGSVGMSGMDGAKLPIDIRMSMVRIDNVATMVGFFDFSDTPATTRTAHRRLVGAATARLRAVLAGEALPKTRPLLEDYEFSDILDKLIAPTQEV